MKPDDIEACRELARRYIATRGGGSITATLGDGGSAVVFHWQQIGQAVALKVYDPKFFAKPAAANAERHRLDLQRRLIGQRCASIVDTLAIDEEQGTCFVSMEYFPGVQLKSVLGRVPDEAIPSLIQQLVSAVTFLEGMNLVHRDIKPENILVSTDFKDLRLLDLGIVREVTGDEDRVDGTDHGDKRPFIATAQYSSPEYLFRLEPPSPALWKALTIYQVGGVLHDLVCKRSLFEKSVEADNKYALAMAVMREPPDFGGAPPILSNWAALAARCLSKDSTLRLKTVEWSDFTPNRDTARERLKRALAIRAEVATRSELSETQIQDLRRHRKELLSVIANSVKARLIGDFTPQLRVSVLGCDDARSRLYLKPTELELGVRIALEISWGSGLRERFGTVRLAAQAAVKHEWADLSGERRTIAEIFAEDEIRSTLLDAVVEAISEIVVRHLEVAETSGIIDGVDLIPITWQAES